MLRSIKSLSSFELKARDGRIGKIEEFLFDDKTFEIKYLVANTGNWLIDQLVLIAPVSLGEPDWGSRTLPVELTTEEIKNSPPLSKDEPVSKQKQQELHRFYGWPGYMYSPFPMSMPVINPKVKEGQKEGDPHLRSTGEVKGYSLQAVDESIGHVEDFIIDDKHWKIRYVIVDTKQILPGKKVIISPQWITQIDWAELKVFVNVSKKQVEESPEFDASQPVNREYEVRLYDYYGRPRYWEK
jgi:uncharacterized protein YrrD